MLNNVCYFFAFLSVFASAYGYDQSVLELKETLSARVGSLCEKSVIAVFQFQLDFLGPYAECASRRSFLNAVQAGLGSLATPTMKESIRAAVPQDAFITLPTMARLGFEPVLEEAARLLDSPNATRDELLCSCQKTKNLLSSLEQGEESVQPIVDLSPELAEEFKSFVGSVALLLFGTQEVFKRDEVVLRASLRSFELVEEAYKLLTRKGVTIKDIKDFKSQKMDPAHSCWWKSIAILQSRTVHVGVCESKIEQYAKGHAALEELKKTFTPCYQVKDNFSDVISEISKLRKLSDTLSK